MLISLGSACKVRQAIQEHLNVDTLESNMFDWVISNFATVLYFIQHIDKPIIDSDFYDTNLSYHKNRLVNHTKLRFNTIHDCDPYQIYETELPLLVKKYNRRLIRLKNHILNEQQIDFIHLVDCEDNHNLSDTKLYIPSSEEVTSFFEGIRKINPMCNVRLHILLPPPNCRTAKEFYNKSFVFVPSEIDKLANETTFIHYVEQDENVNTHGYVCKHWNWCKIFDFIDKMN